MGDVSDDEVWRRLLSGDEKAFGLIWDRHHRRVFRHLVGIGNSPSDAEDMTAVVFLELWRRRSSIRMVDGSALPWLIVTAQNVTRNAARSLRRYRRFLAALPGSDSVPDHAESVADENDERITRLRIAMRACRPVDASLLAMTSLEGFTVKEAAAVLNISESAAKMRLTRLRAHLRAAVGANVITEEG